ncbi:uncharacterized protein PV07_04933 [Cladophialophora immunda]|uniref:Xylanolytic transcriptional activator regulatory domain-containing protein n=1 Tax=Cladophialophora immunda TaxID=569365 RepID=A0A0D2CD90_9EURO|nr:uncharacterized protein PV07_04933 [Cladophialophora immunda]KIW29093.1 hypothetical protein PV07_04933 [Cladophialophora immunda]OQU97029.1 Fungal specific transcription factor domain-containing protein [Cladophialophora immunda]
MEASVCAPDDTLKRLMPLVMGGAGFSYQLHPQPESLPVRRIIKRAFDLGLRTIDTSPYYEPSEQLIGAALRHPEITSSYKRSDYVLMTKVGRIREDYFDYSPEWIRKSVARSLQRFDTSYLDVVFCHDIEFVSLEEALQAVETLYELSNSGVVRCVGISGADINILEAVASRARANSGRAIDIVQIWGQLTLQNTRLEQGGLDAFRIAGVKAVCNSSPLGIGLLRSGGVPVGALGNWHPAPLELRAVCQKAAEWVEDESDNLASVALRFSISRAQRACRTGFNVTTITGIISESDLEENVRAAKQILQKSIATTSNSAIEPSGDLLFQYGDLDEEAVGRDKPLYEGVRKILGRWLDYEFFGSPKPRIQIQAQKDGGRLLQHSSFSYGAPIKDLKYAEERQADPPPSSIDDVLTFILMCIVISGGDFKTDCYPWWSKAVRLSQALGLNRVDANESKYGSGCPTPSHTCLGNKIEGRCYAALEAQEERRRVFWLLFCLDRHLALAFNGTPNISDDECDVYTPLPDDVWENFETVPSELITERSHGPPVLVTGTSFFEYFLPLMAIMGDVIHIHHRRYHPRFGTLDDQNSISMVEELFANCAQSIGDLESRYDTEELNGAIPASEFLTPTSGFQESPLNHAVGTPTGRRPKSRALAQLVTSYSTFILHVLHVLLYGKWDAVSMLENEDGWITSVPFMKCASHAIAASEAVSQILKCDPELTFMPYLFGIYLLHGSFILLLFADRMPQLGANESVEKACETIIRAHEVCVVTLSTEFQVSRWLQATNHRKIERLALSTDALTEKVPQSPAFNAV